MPAIFGYARGERGTAVNATARGAGLSIGVKAISWGTTGIAVKATALSTVGTTYAVRGKASSSDGYGGYFQNLSSSSSGRSQGLYASSDGAQGIAIEAEATATSGSYSYGLWATTKTLYGRAVYAKSRRRRICAPVMGH